MKESAPPRGYRKPGRVRNAAFSDPHRKPNQQEERNRPIRELQPGLHRGHEHPEDVKQETPEGDVIARRALRGTLQRPPQERGNPQVHEQPKQHSHQAEPRQYRQVRVVGLPDGYTANSEVYQWFAKPNPQ